MPKRVLSPIVQSAKELGQVKCLTFTALMTALNILLGTFSIPIIFAARTRRSPATSRYRSFPSRSRVTGCNIPFSRILHANACNSF